MAAEPTPSTVVEMSGGRRNQGAAVRVRRAHDRPADRAGDGAEVIEEEPLVCLSSGISCEGQDLHAEDAVWAHLCPGRLASPERDARHVPEPGEGMIVDHPHEQVAHAVEDGPTEVPLDP